MPSVACPRCGERDELRRADAGSDDRPPGASDQRRPLICEACGHRWSRDLTAHCRLCGSANLVTVPTATLEEAGRGDLRTPSGIRELHHCRACGARDATSSTPEPGRRGGRHGAGDPPRSERRQATADRSESRPAATGDVAVDSAFGTFRRDAVVGGRWRLTHLLARSASGTTWLAVRTDGGARVVFKLVEPALTADPERARLHEVSARAVAALEHPGLLGILDVRRQGTDVLIVAEALLAQTLADAAPVASGALAHIGASAAAALAALHRGGLAHLGVRPSRVLVPEGGRPRLVDLGTGRAQARTGGDRDLTWLAPEQITGSTHTPAADVYSLALTLWAGAGGDLKTLGATASAQAAARIEGDLVRLDAVVADVDPGLAGVLAAAGRRHPDDRPTAERLAEQLRDRAGPRAG